MRRPSLTARLDVALDLMEDRVRLVRCLVDLGRFDAAVDELRGLACFAEVNAVAAVIGARSERNIESPAAGGRHRTGRKDDAARANAAGARKRRAAAARRGNATGEAIAREMAPAGAAAPTTHGMEAAHEAERRSA